MQYAGKDIYKYPSCIYYFSFLASFPFRVGNFWLIMMSEPGPKI